MISYHKIWYHIIRYDMISYHMISYDIISYDIISYHIIWYGMGAAKPHPWRLKAEKEKLFRKFFPWKMMYVFRKCIKIKNLKKIRKKILYIFHIEWSQIDMFLLKLWDIPFFMFFKNFWNIGEPVQVVGGTGSPDQGWGPLVARRARSWAL